MIERYLVDLAAQLAFHGVPRRRAARVVSESRDHLLELAADEGEDAAVARFGPAGAIAADVARTVQPIVLFRAALLFLAALVLFVMPLYGIPENTLPPAPWDERPGHLTWKLQVATGAFGVALVATLFAVFAAWRRLSRFAVAALAVSGAALAVTATVGLIGAVQWAQAVPGSGLTLALTSAATAALSILAAVALAAGLRSGVKLAELR